MRTDSFRQTPPVHVVLVVNAVAASVTARQRQRVADALAAAGSVEVRGTTHRGHAGDLARRAVTEGADVIAVLGGDGTVSEVVDAAAGTSCVVAPLPGGSTNVLARSLGLPRHPAAAAEATALALEERSWSSIGLGSVQADATGLRDPRHFVLHTGVGWDAALVEIVERRPTAKRRGGQLPFVLAGLRTFAGGYDRRRPHFSVTVHRDDHGSGRAGSEDLGEAYFSLVMNSDPYTFVGRRPFTVSPAADRRSPLTVVTLTSMRLAHFLPALVDALRSGHGVRERPGVVVRTGVCGATLRRIETGRGTVRMPYQVDGDHLGEVTRLMFAHHPDSLRVVVPAGIAAAGTS